MLYPGQLYVCSTILHCMFLLELTTYNILGLLPVCMYVCWIYTLYCTRVKSHSEALHDKPVFDSCRDDMYTLYMYAKCSFHSVCTSVVFAVPLLVLD